MCCLKCISIDQLEYHMAPTKIETMMIETGMKPNFPIRNSVKKIMMSVGFMSKAKSARITTASPMDIPNILILLITTPSMRHSCFRH